MKIENLEKYRCPISGEKLELDESSKIEDNKVLEGVLHAVKSNKRYFIREGCVDFITPEQEIKGAAFARKYYSEIAKTYDENVHITFELYKENELEIRNRMINLLELKPNFKVLEVSAGTGKDSEIIASKLNNEGGLWLLDISPDMLAYNMQKLKTVTNTSTEHVVASACAIPFAENSFHCITMGFGLRNVTDKEAALNSMFRVCKPGGKIMILEFSTPTLPGLKPAYDWYSFNILPKMGQLFAQDATSYQYLAESIRMHPSQDDLKAMIERVGFEDCHYHNLNGGIVALHIAYKY